MALESYTSSTLGETIPHIGVESDPRRHPYTMKLKNKFRLGLLQDRPLLLVINAALQLLLREVL